MNYRKYLFLPPKIGSGSPTISRVPSLESIYRCTYFRTTSPAETTNFSQVASNEIKDAKYEEQVSNDEKLQITTLENDLSVISQDVPASKLMNYNLFQMQTDNLQHSIISYLERPQILYEFQWSSSLDRGGQIFPDIRVPFDMLIRQFREKLDTFMSFRATAVITVQLQTQPFQAGRLILAAIPVPSLIGQRKKLLQRVSNLTLLNHVQCDISKQTQVELRIPYVSPLIAYDLVEGRYDWAEVVCRVYSKVTSTSATTVDGIVYVRFEDVALGAPTSMPIFKRDEESTLKAEMTEEPSLLSDFRMRAQEKGITAKAASKTTGGLRKINKNISKYLTFAEPVTDFLDKYLLEPVDDFLGPILNVFGFSRPLTVGDDILLRPSNNFSLFDGTDKSLTLATSVDINAPYIPGLNGTGLDEMSFDYLKKIPQFIDYFSYKAENKIGDILHKYYVRPSHRSLETVKFTYPTTSKQIYQPSHLQYITNPFLYWTGSLVLTYKFVKTDFHSGRVEFTYHPNCNPFDSTGTLKTGVDFDMAYRIVVDLRDKSEVSIRIPYMAVTPFKTNCVSTTRPQEPGDFGAVEYNSGVVIVRALTPLLSSNAVVSSQVEVLVEVNAGNDFQVMNPVTTALIPVTPLEVEPTDDSVDKADDSDWSGYYSDESIRAEMEESSTAGQASSRQQLLEGQDPPSITKSDEMQLPTSSFMVTGEVFKNFRDLTHRTNFNLRLVSSSRFSLPISSLYIPPPFQRSGASGEPFENFYILNRGVSTLGYVGGMYALARGGIRLRILSKQDTYIGARLSTPTTSKADCLYPRAIERTSIKGLAEFQIPYYSRTYQIDHLKYGTSKLSEILFIISSAYQEVIDASGATAGADDIQFGLFIGTPLTLYPSYLQYPSGSDPFEPFPDYEQGSICGWDHISI